MGLSSNPDMEDQSVDGKGCKLFLKCFFGNLFGYEGIDIVEKIHYLRFEDSILKQSRFSYVAEGFDKSMNQLELELELELELLQSYESEYVSIRNKKFHMIRLKCKTVLNLGKSSFIRYNVVKVCFVKRVPGEEHVLV